jgi:hypothetical protein
MGASETMSVDIVATIAPPDAKGRVHVFRDGRIRLETAGDAWDLDVGFDEESKAEWLKFTYIRDLVRDGVTGAELTRAIDSMNRVEEQMRSESDEESFEKLFEGAEETGRRICRERGLDYDVMSDDDINALADELVHEWRRKQR